MDKGGKIKADILVADDSLDDLRLIVKILSFEGHNVRPVIDGDAALASIRVKSPDLILLDICMPKMDGFEVFSRLKVVEPKRTVPVIFVSALGGIVEKMNAFSAGAVDYIAKPYQAEEVVARVATHLSLSFMKREIESSNEILAREISKRRRMEEELLRSQKQLRRLSTHLHTSIEKERARIAREIHDDLGQCLTILKMDLSWLAKRLPGRQPLLLDRIESMSEFAHNAIQSVKMICADLRPGILDDFGIAAAIEWQADEFESRTGIKPSVTIDPEDIVLNERLSTALFRIFQETLTNVLRHAEADEVEITLKKEDHRVDLTVKDNGSGIDDKQIFHGNSFGLLGIRERIHALGGETEISGIPGKGTTVRVTAPIHDG